MRGAIGALSGGLAIAQAVILRRESRGPSRWLWTGLAGVGALNLVMNLPRYAWMLAYLVGAK